MSNNDVLKNEALNAPEPDAIREAVIRFVMLRCGMTRPSALRWLADNPDAKDVDDLKTSFTYLAVIVARIARETAVDSMFARLSDAGIDILREDINEALRNAGLPYGD